MGSNLGNMWWGNTGIIGNRATPLGLIPELGVF